jgi:hypothetical protein
MHLFLLVALLAAPADAGSTAPPPAAPVSVFMQFGRFEQYFDRDSATRYAAAATEPKKVLWHDAAHDLNDPQCLRDRYAWLVEQVGLKPGLAF